MKFKINRDHFSSGLQLVSSVVGARKTMPILQNVLLEAEEGKVSLTTTNLDLGARCSVKAEVSESGTVTLPVKELGNIIRQLADMEVNVETGTEPKATITTRGSVFNVMGMESKEFPPLPALEGQREFDLDRTELIQMLKNVSYAQSVNEERYMLKGVYFFLEEEELSLVATDGRRLALTGRALKTKTSKGGEFILPASSVAELERMPDLGQTICVSFTDRQVAFEMKVGVAKSEEEDATKGFVDSIYLVSKVVEGKYPNYKQVIPKDSFNHSEVERELLQECVTRAALVSDEKVTFRIKANELKITGQSVLGDACESMAIEYEGEDATVSFNPRFLLDPLKALTKDKIIFEFRDDMSPGVFRTDGPKEGDHLSFLCVVMPIRTD
ncbi:MAG: DNA polymerase III subunit beta [Planctomycetes bacterium]|nr:DNA polymerase III subunit beta [Planctomycetota bacterium]